MRILHIITRLILGGAQQNTVISCAAQAAAGHEVALVYGPIYGPEGSLLPDAQKSGARLIELASMRRAILPVHDYVCYRALRRIIREFKPDVVHTHSSKAGIVGRAAAWNEHVPAVIHTIHGSPFYDGQFPPVRLMYIALERWAARRCHKLIGVTQKNCDAFLAQGIGERTMYEAVPSGVDVAMFESPAIGRAQVRKQLNIPDDALVVGLVARLDKLKGQDDLLDILPRLRQHFPSVRLLLVGDGWTRPHLEARVRNEGLASNIVMTGLVPPARVAELLTAMDINTLPSYQEGQPRTLVQALLSGLPVVGYAAGGIPEVCVEGVTGKLAPIGDRDALFEAVAWMLEHPEERRRLGESGREYARQRFDSRIMVKRLDEIYRAALENSVRHGH